MKSILSFFIIILVLCSTAKIFPQEQEFESSYNLVSGVIVQNDYINARLFSEFDKPYSEMQKILLKTWAFEVEPFSSFTLGVGTYSFSGIWSRFNSPSPVSISPLKHAYNIQSRLLPTLPSASSAAKIPSVNIEVNTTAFSINAFSSISFQKETTGGIGLQIPFLIQGKKELPLLKGKTVLAWKMIELQSKDSTTWFLQSKSFPKEILHSVIQEILVESSHNTLLTSIGFTQMPYEKPGAFFRTEYSLEVNPFLLNLHAFLCTKHYLSHSGSIEKNPIQVSINPQFRAQFYSGLLRSIKIGLTSKFQVNNGDTFFSKTKMTSSFNASAEIKLLMMSLVNTASISDLLISPNEKEKIQLQKESSFSYVSKIAFIPWYLESLQRDWSFQMTYNNDVLNNNDLGDGQIKLYFRCTIPTTTTNPIFATAFYEANLKFEESMRMRSFQCGIKITGKITTKFFEKEQSLTLSAQTELATKEKLTLQSATSAFTILLNL